MLIQESEVSIKRIEEILKGAFVEIAASSDDHLLAKGENISISIGIDHERKFIRLYFMTKLQYLNMAEACQACNLANNSLVNVKFYVEIHEGSVILICDRDIPYERNLVAYHIVSALRMFDTVVVHAIRNVFSNYL